ncbi:MAG: glycosyltransferase family 9 protein [Chthoniobacteraceae bacterium]
MSKPRILVIRGGAIGDFVLTLPAIRMLRQTLLHCHLEILGYRHIAELALHGGPEEGTTYADAVRSIEYGPLAAFFARGGQLTPELCEYFAGFQQVVSWLFDPDGIFAANLERAGVRNYLGVYEKIADQPHASLQLARGLERMAIFLEDHTARLFPNAASKDAAHAWLAERGLETDARTLVAIHPGSGSPRKNWPVGNWQRLADRVTGTGSRLLLIGGEADTAVLDSLAKALAIHQPLVARHLPLATLAALLARCASYFGHDTGISHIAAAAGTPSTLLFGPTDPATWAPQGPHVRVLSAPGGNLSALAPDSVPLSAS